MKSASYVSPNAVWTSFKLVSLENAASPLSLMCILNSEKGTKEREEIKMDFMKTQFWNKSTLPVFLMTLSCR